MSDQKISELTAITGANTADDDLLVIVDTSANETKKITLAELEAGIARGDMTFGDNEKAIFGAGSDLQIYHDSDVSYIKEGNATGSLQIWCKDFEVYNAGGTETLINADVNAGVQLYYDNSQKLSTTSTGIDVTGTATMDGLTVDGGTGLLRLGNGDTSLVDNQEIGKIEFYSSDSSTNSSGATFEIVNRVDGANWFAGANPNELLIRQTGTSTEDVGTGTAKDRLLISKDGDISFYEDTGTTAKFFWDASAEGVAIGSTTVSSNAALDVTGGRVYIDSGDTFGLRISNASNIGGYIGAAALSNLAFYSSGGSERMRIDSSGNVGIGTSSPSSPLHVNTDTVNSELFRLTSASATLKINEPTAGVIQINSTGGGDSLAFATVGSERLRIDSSGNLLVGTTDSNPANNNAGTTADKGIKLGGGSISAAMYQGTAAYFNRTSTDGDIIDLRKDGSTVGSIGVSNTDRLTIGASDGAGIEFDGDNSRIQPASDGTGTLTNGVLDIGSGAWRFKDLYLSGGVVFGTTGGDVTSKTLDDYEEGTFTPTVYDASTGGNAASMDNAIGRYTKVGRIVHFAITLSNINTTGMTGTNNFYIRDLPFNLDSSARSESAVRLDRVNFSGYVVAAQSADYMFLKDCTSGSSDQTLTVNAVSSGNADILISGTYEVG